MAAISQQNIAREAREQALEEQARREALEPPRRSSRVAGRIEFTRQNHDVFEGNTSFFTDQRGEATDEEVGNNEEEGSEDTRSSERVARGENSDQDANFFGLDDDESVGDSAEDPDMDAETTSNEAEENQPNTSIRDQFLQFAAPSRFVAPLERVHVTGVKLMDILRKKKSPLNAYSDLFQWNLHERDAIMDHEGLEEAGGRGLYIGREALMAKLIARYNMTGRVPK